MVFNLSEKINDFELDRAIDLLRTEDVKEFIRLLKEKYHGVHQEYPALLEKLDKLAGDELI